MKHKNELGIVVPKNNDSSIKTHIVNQNLRVTKPILEKALVFYEEKRWLQSISCCQAALQISADLGEAYRIWGNCLQQLGRTVEAIEQYIKAEEVNPDSAQQEVSVLAKYPHKPESSQLLLSSSNQELSTIKPQNSFSGQNDQETEESVKVKVDLGDLYASEKQWQSALKFYLEAIKLKPKSATIYIKLAQVYRQVNQPEAFAICMYRAHVLEPTMGSAKEHFVLGNLLLNQHKIVEATACFRKAWEMEPGFTQARDKLEETIELYQQKNASAKAKIDILDGKSDKVPDESKNSHGSLNTTATADVIEGDLVQFQHQVDRNLHGELENTLVKTNGSSLAQESINQSQSFYDLALDAEREEDWQLAISCYGQAIRINSLDWKSNYSLGAVFSKQKLWQKAIEAYQKSAAINPEYFWTHHNLGEAFLELKQWKTAIAAFERAIELNPSFSWSHYKLGTALMELKQMKEAATKFRASIKLNPDFDWVHHKLGDVLVVLKDWDGAINSYRQALFLTPDLPQTAEKLNDALRKRSEFDRQEVEKFYQTAIEQEPENESLYYKSLEVKPNDPSAYIRLAQINAAKGNEDTAIAFYKIALQLQPHNSDIIEALKKLKSSVS